MKGTAVSQFRVGAKVRFFTGPALRGKWSEGTITNLHKSGSTGVAEIRRLVGRKVRRKLQFVEVSHD